MSEKDSLSMRRMATSTQSSQNPSGSIVQCTPPDAQADTGKVGEDPTAEAALPGSATLVDSLATEQPSAGLRPRKPFGTIPTHTTTECPACGETFQQANERRHDYYGISRILAV